MIDVANRSAMLAHQGLSSAHEFHGLALSVSASNWRASIPASWSELLGRPLVKRAFSLATRSCNVNGGGGNRGGGGVTGTGGGAGMGEGDGGEIEVGREV